MVRRVVPVSSSQAPPPPPTLGERAWLVGSALAPALIAAGQLDLCSDGSRDAGVLRTVGLGYAGALRALDAWLSALFAALPLGTRALRAEVPGVLLLSAASALMFTLVRRRLAAVPGAAGWASVVAGVATATLSFSYPFQHEAASPASSLAGVVLVLAVLVHVDLSRRATSRALLAFLVTLGLSYDPAVGLCVLAAAVAGLAARPVDADPSDGLAETLLAAAAGLLPFALATLHARVTPLSTSARLFAWPTGAPPSAGATSLATGVRHALGLLRAELGEVLLLLSLAGLVVTLATRRTRRAGVPLALVTVLGGVALVHSTSSGVPDAWTPGGLVALAGIVAFAGVAMHEAVVRVARARLPLAGGSAAMVVVLEAAFPTILLDDWLARSPARPPLALVMWEDTAFAGLPVGTRLLVSAPRLYARLLATEATGDLPGDLALIPTFDPSNEGAADALARDPRLVPLFRDIVLTGAPGELSMSTLSTAMPLAVAADPRWQRTLSRHLIPSGLLALFEPEPRGGADRKHALEATAPARARLAKALGLPAGLSDAPLASLTSAMLLDRALGAVGAGEHEVGLQALSDAALFAPKDARIQRLMLLVANAKGPVEVQGLVYEGLAAELR